MAFGSAFDSFVKHALVRHLYGEQAVQRGEPYHLETLFASTVDPEQQAWAWETGKWAFSKYQEFGAFDALLSEMKDAKSLPKFEDNLNATITLPSGTQIPLHGYPDGWYRNAEDQLIILDWKCNGYKAKSNISPRKHYILQRPKLTPYKTATVKEFNGITINEGICFSEVSPEWATQILLYSWMLGEPVGHSPVVAQIDQILLKPSKTEQEILTPGCRIVTYRSLILEEFQQKVISQLEDVWKAVQRGSIYLNMDEEEAHQRVQQMAKLTQMQLEHNPILAIVRQLRGKS